MATKKKLLIAGFLLAFAVSGVLSAAFPNNVRFEGNLWFGADIGRVIDDMAEPLAIHDRLRVHPLFSLIVLPVARPVYWIGRLMGFEGGPSKCIAAQFVTSVSAGATWVLIYLLAIRMGLSRLTSVGISLLFLSTSAFMFWWSTPETFPLGAVTILLPFFLLADNVESRKIWILALVGSVSITITNWSAGLIASLARFGPRRLFFRMCVLTLFSCGILIVIQKSYLPSAGLPFEAGEERVYLKENMQLINTVYQFFVAPVIPLAPPKIIVVGAEDYWQLQFDMPQWFNISSFHSVPILAWILLLANGIYAAFWRRRSSLSLALILFLGFQFLLHSIYGDTPFLYSAHYIPVMILLAGHGLTVLTESQRKLMALLIYALVIILFPLNLGYLYESFKLGVAHLAG